VAGMLFLFVDGVGLAPASVANPLATAPTPAFDRLLGGPLTVESCGEEDGRLLVAVDADLGVSGLPQSATGQTALFTGVNGATLLGRHATAFPGPRLQEVIREHGLFRQAVARSLRATFANPYTPSYFERVAAGKWRHSVTTWAALGAGLQLRGIDDLLAGRAVSWDIRRDRFGTAAGLELPVISPQEAGAHLAGLAAAHDLTVYETFLPDMAGHRRFGLEPREAVVRLDGLLAGVLSGLDPETTLLLTSDHGNLEEAGHRQHTANPVPLLAVGPLAQAFAAIRSILEVTPAILAALGGAAP
jgi:2,3-bisphosphoglycerate-independent phosphoglycerate mutase